VLLLYLGDVNRAAVAGAGFALAGAVATRILDIAHERRVELAREIQRRRADLDETRRLAYMAIIVGGTISPRSPELVATIVNALAHHGAGVDPMEAANHVAAVIYGDKDESAAWLQAQIDRISAEHGRLERIR
jgi:hypothetical protein